MFADIIKIVKQNRIPFEIIADDNLSILDRLPKTVNADQMTDEELHLHLLEGFHAAVNGKSRPAAQVFA